MTWSGLTANSKTRTRAASCSSKTRRIEPATACPVSRSDDTYASTIRRSAGSAAAGASARHIPRARLYE